MWKKVLGRTTFCVGMIVILGAVFIKWIGHVELSVYLADPRVWCALLLLLPLLAYKIGNEFVLEMTIEELKKDKHGYIFRKHGPKRWMVKFEDEVCFLDNRKGVLHIAQLLANKNIEISAIELCHAVNPTPSEMSELSEPLDTVIDQDCLKQYQETLKHLRIDLEQAKKDNDLAEEDSVQKEIDEITEVLSSSVGLRGRLRQFSNNKIRARCSVTMAINRVVKSIKDDYPKLYLHLKNSIHTGETCSYKSDCDIDWQL